MLNAYPLLCICVIVKWAASYDSEPFSCTSKPDPHAHAKLVLSTLT